MSYIMGGALNFHPFSGEDELHVSVFFLGGDFFLQRTLFIERETCNGHIQLNGLESTDEISFWVFLGDVKIGALESRFFGEHPQTPRHFPQTTNSWSRWARHFDLKGSIFCTCVPGAKGQTKDCFQGIWEDLFMPVRTVYGAEVYGAIPPGFDEHILADYQNVYSVY